MKCPNCNTTLQRIAVKVHGASEKVVSYQCASCEHFSFEQKSAAKVLDELRSPLRIKQKVVKLSADRLGIYFSKDIIRSIGLKKGENLYVSIPDEKRIVLERE